MNLDRVTITGPDDSVSPAELLSLSREFPFVEWGILVSENHSRDGSPRFPSRSWLVDLKQLALRESLALSMHLCGRWVRELLLGNLFVPPSLTDGPWFQRIQLNFHAERTRCEPERFALALRSLGSRQFIFQIDGASGNAHLESAWGTTAGEGIDAVPLFDISGGAGILPAEWPKPLYMNDDTAHCYHGYAGGLGPENLEQQLPRIADAAGDAPIWVDMETRVRSDSDRLFDLAKVRRCLEICTPFVVQQKEDAARVPA